MKTFLIFVVLLILFVYFFIIRKNKRQKASDFDQMWFLQSAGTEVLEIIIDNLRISQKFQVVRNTSMKKYVAARQNEEAHWLFTIPLTHENGILHGKLYCSKKMLLSHNYTQKEIEKFSKESLQVALHEVFENDSCREQQLVS
jgi:hypothetical protein